MYYINIFFIFSLIGHIMENFIYTNVDSGILYGPWTPIYGVGALTIILINKYFNKIKLNKFIKPIILFLICGITLSLVEMIGGYYIELVYGRIFWNYSRHFVPIGRYTSLQMMIIWAIAAVGLIYLVLPYIEKPIKKIPKLVSYILSILFIIDLAYTFHKLSVFNFTNLIP